MSDIKKARALIGEALGFATPPPALLVEALAFMTREKTIRRAPRKSRKLTTDAVREVRAVIVAEPETPFLEIAHRYGIGQGRVSEIWRDLYRGNDR